MNDSPYHTSRRREEFSRREFLWRSGGGLGGIALSSLLGNESRAQNAGTLSGKQHFPAKAKRVIQLFMAGAASHVDTFDYKPLLAKRNGEKWDVGEKVELFQSEPGSVFASPWGWKQYGHSGKWMNNIVAPLGSVADELAFVHNLVGKTGVHSQATYLQSTGFQLPGFPGMGAWVSYGLGSLNDNLPTFVVLPDHRGFASNGQKNWDAAFLPAQHSGTIIFPGREVPVADLFPHKSGNYINAESEAETHALLTKLNRAHAVEHEGDNRLDARIRSYELAAHLQMAAPEALDISNEPEYIRTMYGIDQSTRTWPQQINAAEEADYFGRKCLVARRLLERGVRFVQIWSGNDNGFPRRNWDSHEDIKRDHEPLALGMATGAAALIKDLKDRGMLEDTIVFWTTEFGRMPCAQGGMGRDHNPFVFTNWLAGGGIRSGTTYGASDEWGYKPADPAHHSEVYDIHATILRLLGINHEKLVFRHNGIDRRLTDVHGHVIEELIG